MPVFQVNMDQPVSPSLIFFVHPPKKTLRHKWCTGHMPSTIQQTLLLLQPFYSPQQTVPNNWKVLPKVICKEHIATPPPHLRIHSPAAWASCTMRNATEVLQKHYRAWQSHYGSITGHYRMSRSCYWTLRSVTEHYRVLQDVTEGYRSIVNHYRTLWEHCGEPLRTISILPIQHRMYSSAACASCTMSTAGESSLITQPMVLYNHTTSVPWHIGP